MHKTHTLPRAFAELGIEAAFLHTLAQMQFTEPTDIQRELIPLALEGKDVLGQARTGTGKTLAFGLPLLQMADPKKRLQGLVLVPTRELAVQVTGELRRVADHAGLRVVPVYGGEKVKRQQHLLGRKPHVVVATPGRAMDFMRRGVLRIAHIRFAILDEVDRMLDIGFRDDIRQILSEVTGEHQTIFVSATLDDEIKRLAKKYMRDPIEVNVSRDELTVDEVGQSYVTVDAWDKFRMLKMLLAQEKPKLAIIFTNTKHAARKLTRKLHDLKVNAKEIHGDLVQQKRERVMDRFRKHKIQVLVATDLAARGIDVNGISHIINYDIPQDPEVYVHRIGRTARMGTFGKAITLVTRDQGKELTEIERLINKEVPVEEVEGFEPSPAPDAVAEPEPAPPAATSRYVSAANGASDEAPTAKPKRLGSKFRPRRRRR
jgi:ATP-dependent RNA helicase DeaD